MLIGIDAWECSAVAACVSPCLENGDINVRVVAAGGDVQGSDVMGMASEYVDTVLLAVNGTAAELPGESALWKPTKED